MVKPKNITSISPILQLEIELPDKKYFTIGEVSELCGLKSHVLRYWEQVFPMLEPSKRRGRRYYQRNDVEMILEIKSLLQEQGFTIPGAKSRLAKGCVRAEAQAFEDENSVLSKLQKMHEENHQFQKYLKNRF